MPDNSMSLIPLALLIVVFYLLVLRPARKRQREFNQTQDSLQPGQEVMLASGIFGSIAEIGDDVAQVEVAPGTVIKVNRRAIASVVQAPGEQDVTAEDQDVQTGPGSAGSEPDTEALGDSKPEQVTKNRDATHKPNEDASNG